MFRIRLIVLLALAMLAAGCGYGSNYNGGGGGNAAPAITSLSPATATAGDPAFTLTVNGSGFGSDSVVYWNGAALPSSYGTGTKVTASVSAADVANVGSFPIYVHSGGKNSNSMMFTVQ